MRVVDAGSVPVVTTASADDCIVYSVTISAQAKDGPAFSEFDALVSEMDAEPVDAAHLAAGRQWVAQAFYRDRHTLASLRLATGLSQRQFGERCGLAQPHISRYESGRHEPTLTTAQTMAQALGVNLEVFVAAWGNTVAASTAGVTT